MYDILYKKPYTLYVSEYRDIQYYIDLINFNISLKCTLSFELKGTMHGQNWHKLIVKYGFFSIRQVSIISLNYYVIKTHKRILVNHMININIKISWSMINGIYKIIEFIYQTVAIYMKI